jgi:hypothetical protein
MARSLATNKHIDNVATGYRLIQIAGKNAGGKLQTAGPFTVHPCGKITGSGGAVLYTPAAKEGKTTA